MADREPFHLVVFTDTFFETNGVGSFYRTLLDWSRRTADVRVTIICPEHVGQQPDVIEPDVVAVRPWLKIRNPFYKDLIVGAYSRAALRRLVRNLPGDKVIHIGTSGTLGVAGARVARDLGIASVGWYHTDLRSLSPLYVPRWTGRLGTLAYARLAEGLDRRAYGLCTAMCVPSESAAHSIESFFGRETFLVPNPIDLTRFQPAENREGSFREKYLKGREVLAVVIGRLAREKNLDLVCELLGSDPRISLVFVGDGPHAQSLRDNFGAEVTGFLHGQDLVGAYQQADVFVQLALHETFGLTLVEAMSAGLPAIVLRSGGFASKITPGNGVEIVDEEELPQLADRCVELVSDSERHAQASKQVRQFVEQLGADGVLPRMIEFHKAVAAGGTLPQTSLDAQAPDHDRQSDTSVASN